MLGEVCQSGKFLNIRKILFLIKNIQSYHVFIDDPYSHPKFNPDIDKKNNYKTRNILAFPIKDQN